MIRTADYTIATPLTTWDLCELDYVLILRASHVEVLKQRGEWLPGKDDPEPGQLLGTCSVADVLEEFRRVNRSLTVLWIPESAVTRRERAT